MDIEEEEALEEVEAMAEEEVEWAMMAMGEAERSATSATAWVILLVSARRSKTVATVAMVLVTFHEIAPNLPMTPFATPAIVPATLPGSAQKVRRRLAIFVVRLGILAETAPPAMAETAVE